LFVDEFAAVLTKNVFGLVEGILFRDQFLANTGNIGVIYF
jgi:hypothetical protein